MRKEAGFEVTDHIRVYLEGNDRLAAVLEDHRDEIGAEVLADQILTGRTGGYSKEWNINGEKAVLGVERQ